MPYGQVLVDTVKDSLNNVLAPASAVFRNRIINGAMVIDQRNSGASVTPVGGQYTLDRWALFITQASKASIQQNAGSVTPPVGFTNYLGATSLSAYSVAASDYFMLNQAIEGFNCADLSWGSANAKTVTLSFQVYSSLTGTFGGALNNNAGSRSYPFSYSIPVANTWTTISITIAGDTAGTWTTNNTAGIWLRLGLGVGSTYSATAGAWAGGFYFAPTGATSVVGTSGATFYITGVQLEVGTNATSFDYRPYGTELALCQRYFQSWGGVANSWQIQGYNTAGSNTAQSFSLPVTLRSAPTYTLSGTPTYSNASAFNVQTIIGNNVYGLFMYVTTTSTGPFYATSGTSTIQLSSEL